MGSSTRVAPLAKTTFFSPTSAKLKPSMLSPSLMRRGTCGAAGAPGRGAPSPSCTMAKRLEPRIAVPSKVILLIRCVARLSASASLVRPAPLSGSKRFLATITSVPRIAGPAFASTFRSSRSTGRLGFTGRGKSHGPSCHTEYTLRPIPAKDTNNRIASTVTRVRIFSAS
jgi:hypothetical protein